MNNNFEKNKSNLQANSRPNNGLASQGDHENDDNSGLNELLNDYGVQTEEIEPIFTEQRLEKMRERSINKTPTSQQEALKKSPLALLLWFIGCLLLIALLFAQYAIFNVNDLIKNPTHRNKLISACNMLSCSLPAADLESFAIINLRHRPSRVESTDTDMDILADIQNTSNEAQLYPNLKVTINGENGKLGEFIAAPADYLPVNQEQLSANQKKGFMFTVSLKDSEVSNVNIEPIY